jgi:hypothetical protein
MQSARRDSNPQPSPSQGVCMLVPLGTASLGSNLVFQFIRPIRRRAAVRTSCGSVAIAPRGMLGYMLAEGIRTHISAARAAACYSVCMLASSGAGRSPPADQPDVFSVSVLRTPRTSRESRSLVCDEGIEPSCGLNQPVLTQSDRAFVCSPRGARGVLISVATRVSTVPGGALCYSVAPADPLITSQFADTSLSGRIVRLPLVWRSIT